jgi:hypothetical protein
MVIARVDRRVFRERYRNVIVMRRVFGCLAMRMPMRK